MLSYFKTIETLQSLPIGIFSQEYSFFLGCLYQKKGHLDQHSINILEKIQNFTFLGMLSKHVELFFIGQLIGGNNISNLLEAYENTPSEETLYSLLDGDQELNFIELYSYAYTPKSPQDRSFEAKTEESANPGHPPPEKQADEGSACKERPCPIEIPFECEPEWETDYYEGFFNSPYDPPRTEYESLQERFTNNEISCLICYDSITIEQYFPLSSCADNYHVECFLEYLNSEISDKHLPIRCPKCTDIIPESDLRDRLEPECFERYQRFSLEKLAECHPEEYSCCPTPNCQYLFIPNQQSMFTCPLCTKEYCLACRVDFHRGITCQEFQQDFKASGYNDSDQLFMAFVKGNKFKQCPRCRFWVEKNRGCNHMTCRCRYEFCYICAAVHKTCKCSLF